MLNFNVCRSLRPQLIWASQCCMGAVCSNAFILSCLRCLKLPLFLICKKFCLSKMLCEWERTVQLPFKLGSELLGRLSVELVTFKSIISCLLSVFCQMFFQELTKQQRKLRLLVIRFISVLTFFLKLVLFRKK